MDLIECPECGLKMKNLKMHLFYKHNLNMSQFREKYPEFGVTQLHTPREKIKCPFCNNGKLYTPNGLGTHISYIHNNTERGNPENKIKAEKRKEAKEGYICPICNKKYKNLSQHVEITHKISWEDFIVEYNWAEGKAFFSEEHKKNLSLQKTDFYNDPEEGYNRRNEQSIRSSNQRHSRKTKEYLSILAAERYKNKDIYSEGCYQNRGIIVKYKDNLYKSMEEFKICLLLENNNIVFSYENESICYKTKDQVIHNYTPDFVINDLYFEVKVDANKVDYLKEHKYSECKNIIESLGNTFFIGGLKDIAKFFNIPILRNFEFISICKKLLDEDQIVLRKFDKKGNFSFFKKLDANYENNKNFICSRG